MEILGLAAAGYRLHKNGKKRQEWERVHASVTQQLQVDSPGIHNVHTEYFRGASLQQVLAMLVDGVYSRDQKGIDYNLVVKPFLEQEYEVDERVEHYRAFHWTHMQQWTSYEDEVARGVGLAHYLRKDDHPNAVAPRLVIALRGTKLSSRQDLRDDFKIGIQCLDSSERFQTCESLVTSLIKKFLEHHHGTPADICITGHSLGATIALLIAKNLAAKNQRYAVHCFNPPFISLIHLIPSALLHLLKGVSELPKTAARMVLRQFSAIHTDKVIAQVDNFVRLVDWTPVLYVNEHDCICSRYLKYYVKKSKWSLNETASKAMHMSRVLGKYAKYSALVPSVAIYVNSRQPNSHDLKQWYTEPQLTLPKHEYQLLGRLPTVSSRRDNSLRFDVVTGRFLDHGDDNRVEAPSVAMGSVGLLSQTAATAATMGGQYPPQTYQNLQFLQQYPQQSINLGQQHQLQSISIIQEYYQQPSINTIHQECAQQCYPPAQSDQQYGQQLQYQQAAAVQIGGIMNSSGTEHSDLPFMSMGVPAEMVGVGQHPQQSCYPPQR